MTVIVKLKDADLTIDYINVEKIEIMSKEAVKNEVDSTSYDELANLIFRIKLANDEQATFSMDENFDYEIL